MKSILSLVLSILAGGHYCLGDLVFSAYEQELHPEVGVLEVVATFNFRNEGSEAVTILNMDSSCSCSVPTLAKERYQPGEEGQIEIIFTPGKRQGWQTKYLKVYTDWQKEPYILTLRAYIAPPLEITPRQVLWEANDRSEKLVQLVVKTAEPQKIVEVISSEQSIGWTIETVEEGRQYTLHLHPQEDVRALFGVVQIVTDHPNSSLQRYHLTFQMRPSTSAP